MASDTECKENLMDNFTSYRCSNNIWKDGFCKIHHPESKKARREKSEKRWEEKRKGWDVAWDKVREREKDSERLDWCEKHIVRHADHVSFWWDDSNGYHHRTTGENFRQAIDKAMEEEKLTRKEVKE